MLENCKYFLTFLTLPLRNKKLHLKWSKGSLSVKELSVFKDDRNQILFPMFLKKFFLQHIILLAMDIFHKIKLPLFTLRGNCKKCGHCCRTITFMIDDKYVTDESEFEKLKEIDPKYNHFYPSGIDENGVMFFTCKSLTEDNLCVDYVFRSLYCRLYPHIRMKALLLGAELPDECGYYVEKNKQFKDFLK